MQTEIDDSNRAPQPIVLTATDPANRYDPANWYGAANRWLTGAEGVNRPAHSAGDEVVLLDGMLVANGAKGRSQVTAYWRQKPKADGVGSLVAAIEAIRNDGRPLYVAKINGQPVSESDLADDLLWARFVSFRPGFVKRAPTANQVGRRR